MSGEPENPGTCQVDFYLLGEAAPGASKLACRLALMAWERSQSVFVITTSNPSAEQLGELMWQYPEERFLPHAQAGAQDSGKAPVLIGVLADLKPADVVINLCPEAVPQPEEFKRVLEIVPCAEEERQASRTKYKTYRNQGLKPRTHEINK
ncbi:MAG: DNA polymerase III subunit chi [Gammaproteobacteria bacterium]|nr:DNA polymerase III subunit chi [Gammaproteobacteria bacterium]NNK98269.1 DNA polymerase III subunit chi [Xanthomonadales bacterium]